MLVRSCLLVMASMILAVDSAPAAEEAMPALTEALLDDEPSVREAASQAIDTIQQGSKDS